jgi:hypothetical protein
VQAKRGLCADWRDRAAYAALLDADRSLLAWEWLRRDPRYRLAAERALSAADGSRASARAHGLVAFEDPLLSVPFARPIWRSEDHPYVLRIEPAAPALAPDRFDLGRLGDMARLHAGPVAEHLLLSNGLNAVQLDGPPGAFSAGPVRLRYRIAGLDSAERPLLSLRRFLALWRTGDFSRSLHRREPRARRWILMLRAHDALASGADQRTIAEVLLSPSVADAQWRTREPSIRSQVQRLVRSARQMASGGYRILLL